MKRRSSWGIAIVLLAAVAALSVCVALCVPLVGHALTSLRPGVTLVLAIDAAHPYHAGLAPEEARRLTIERLHERLAPLTESARFRDDGTRLEVTLPRDVDPERAAQQLTRSGRLEFKVVDDGSDMMRALADFARLHGVAAGKDGWSERDSGAPHPDVFVHDRDRTVLAKLVRSFPTPIPSDHEIVLGHDPSAVARGAEWRSYYVLARAELDGEHISDAELFRDTTTNRPEVALTFDADGARAFESLTARAVGRKVAILLEGVVTSAPVIEGRVTGNHARITIGGETDSPQPMQEALDVISVLRFGALPAPVTLLETRAPRR